MLLTVYVFSAWVQDSGLEHSMLSAVSFRCCYVCVCVRVLLVMMFALMSMGLGLLLMV